MIQEVQDVLAFPHRLKQFKSNFLWQYISIRLFLQCDSSTNLYLKMIQFINQEIVFSPFHLGPKLQNIEYKSFIQFSLSEPLKYKPYAYLSPMNFSLQCRLLLLISDNDHHCWFPSLHIKVNFLIIIIILFYFINYQL